MKHTITTENGKGRDPEGYQDWHQKVCTCGWKGPKRENYENLKYTMLSEDETRHIRSVQNESEVTS